MDVTCVTHLGAWHFRLSVRSSCLCCCRPASGPAVGQHVFTNLQSPDFSHHRKSSLPIPLPAWPSASPYLYPPRTQKRNSESRHDQARVSDDAIISIRFDPSVVSLLPLGFSRSSAILQLFSKFCLFSSTPIELRHHLRFLIPLLYLGIDITSHPPLQWFLQQIISAISSRYPGSTGNLHFQAKPIANLRSRPSFLAPSFRPPRRPLPRLAGCTATKREQQKGIACLAICLGSNPNDRTATHRTAPHRTDRTYLLLYLLLTHSSPPFSLQLLPPIPIPRLRLRHLTITLGHPINRLQRGPYHRDPYPRGATLGRYSRQIEILVSPPATHSIQNPLASFPHLANITLSTTTCHPFALKPSTIRPSDCSILYLDNIVRALSRSVSISSIAYLLTA